MIPSAALRAHRALDRAERVGRYLHHGDWEARTHYPPPDFWNHVAQSGVGAYYMTQAPGNLRTGTLAQLPKGDLNAFDAVVRAIRARVDGAKP